MANKVPLAYADVELQISSAISVGDTSFTLSSANDDDGNALPAGKYCFTLDNGSSNKEYLLGQLNGTAVTSVVSVSRQGVESSGAVRAHRVGAPAIVSDFATIQRVADILRGQETLDGASPISYDSEPTLSNREELATVAYVIDTAAGATVAFDNQVVTSVNAGETVAAGDLVYFKTTDQEWYKTDADTAATVEGVQLGIALGAGTDGAAITGGVQIAGVYTTTGLTAGDVYYAGNTAGAYTNSAGTTKQAIGLALSTTRLLLIPRNPQTVTSNEKDAMTGVNNTPSSTNQFVTTDDLSDPTVKPPQVVKFTASGTWTKDAGLKYVIAEVQGAGGRGSSNAGGGGGGFSKKLILASALGSTETVTVGTASLGSGNTSFGTHALGGNGGNAVDDTVGAAGAASSGDLNINGQVGQDGFSSTGGGGGGSSVLGMGGRFTPASSATAQTTGEAAAGYGGGGAGNADASDGSPSASGNGGAGTAGIVIVTEYYS